MRRLLFSIVMIVAVLAGAGAPAQTARAQGPVINAELNKSFTPISIVAGQITRLNITIFNTNAFALENASWTDNLIGVQPGMRLADPVNLSNTCGGAVTAEPNGTTIALSGGQVPPQVGVTLGSCSVEVDVTSTVSGNLVNTIPAGVLTATGGGMDITNTTPASATLRVGVVQPPSLSKAFNSNTVYVGQTSQLTITIRNTDLVNALTELSVTDTLPPNVALASPVAASLTACGASATLLANSGTRVITLSNASISPNTSCLVRVNVVSVTPGTYTNTIDPGAISTRQGVTNGSNASAPLNVQAVGITKAFSPATFQAGGESTLTITLRNPTGAPYTTVNITDTLPAIPNTNLTVVPGSATTTCGGTAVTTLPRSVTLTGGTIPAGTPAAPGSCIITVRVTVPAAAPAATYTNTIPANAMNTDQGVTNNLSASANVNIYAQGAGISGAAKSFSPNPISPGENTRLRITIPAPADTALTNFSITDLLPAGMTISNSTIASQTNCGAAAVINAPTGGGTFSLTNGTIAAGATCTINVYVTATVGGVYQNTIPPANISNDQNRRPTSNITASLTVRTLSGMTMAKAFYPTTVNPNGISTLTIALTNTNTSALTGVSLTDPLPFTNATNGVFAAPTPNISTTCGSGSVVVNTAANQSQTVVMTDGTIPAQVGGVAGVCTINIDVIGRGSATTRTNTIPTTNVSATISATGDVIAPQAAATATLTIANISIGVVKGFTPLTIFGGSASTLTVQLNNPTNAQLIGIAFTDNMPTGMIIANPPNLNVGTCGGAISGVPGASTFSFSGGSLPPAGSCSLSLSVTMTANANLTNIIPVNAVTTTNGARNPQATQATLTNLPGASVSKVFSPNPVVAGLENTSLLTITIQNTGNTPITSMALLDRLPAGLQIAGAPAAVNNCGGALAADVAGTDILLSGGVLAGNMSCTIVVPISGANPGSYRNSIPAGALSNLEGATNTLPAEDTLVLTARPELSLVKSSSFDPGADGYANPGEIISYAFLVRNSGNVPLTDVVVTDPLPALSAIACPQTTLAVDEVMTCTATYAVTQADIEAGSVYNLATADSDESTPVTDENTQPLPQNPALSVEKSSTTTSLSAPGTVTYDYLVTNTGNVTLTGIILTDNNDNDDMTCPSDTLAVGTSMTCTATHTFTQAELDAGGSLDNIVTADSAQTEPVTDDLSIPISQNAAMTVVKSSATASLSAPATVTYDYLVTNTGNVTLTGIVLSDNNDNDDLTCPATTLAVGASMTCTATHTFTQAELDAGGTLDNIVTADSNETEPVTDDLSIPITQNPAMTVVKSSATASLSAPATVTYDYLVTNTGNVTLTGIVVSDNNDNDDMVCESDTLVVGAHMTCTATHTFTQTELDAGGTLDNIVTADSAQTEPVTDDLSIPITRNADISLVKAGTFDAGADSYANIGELISYEFVVTNTGNTTLTGIAVTDPLVGPVSCPADTLAVGASMTCTATYAVTQADINAGSVYNLASVDSNETVPVEDDNTQSLPQNPAMTVGKSSATASLSAPATVTYDYLVTNTGNVTLTAITLSDDNDNDDLTCPADTLAVGTSMTCTATHTFTQAELEAGGSLDNIVTADSDETEPVTDDLSIPISQNPAITLEKTGTLHMDTAAPDDEVNPGDTITYAFTITNTGNVTLTDITLSDTVGGVTISGGPLDELAPGESDNTTFTGSYTLTQEYINAGSFTNTATVSASTPSDETVSDLDEHVQALPGAPAVGVAKRLLSDPVEVSPGVWNVIYEIVVRNYGNLPVDDLQVDEDLADTFPPDTIFVINDLSCTGCLIDPAFNGTTRTGLLAGTETLPVGGEFVIQLDLNVTPDASGPFNNTAAVSGSTPAGDPVSDDSQNGSDPDPDGDNDPTNNDEPTPVDFGPSLFDPPIGFKTVNSRRLPVLRWTVVWVNNSNIVAIDAVSSDPIPQGSAFDDDGVPSGYPLPAGPLPTGSTASGVSCVDSSDSTSTTYCYYEGPSTEYPRGRVVWQGTLGPDFGVTNVDLALNRINIIFSTRVSRNTSRVSNTAVIDTDRNGDGDVADAGEARSATASAAWRRRAAQDEELPATGFAPGKITQLPRQPAGLAYAALDDLKLQIPALKLDAPILAVPLGEDGWRVDWLGSAVGYLEGSAFPTWNGNSVLTAHVYDANGKPGPFVNLGSLRWGDRVVVRAFGQNYIYEVRSARASVRPDEANVITHEETPWLTLITCQGYDEATGGYRWRTVVRAVLVKVE